MKLTDYIVHFFNAQGIHHFFGYQGTMIAHFVDSIVKDKDAHNHSCYNEQGAAFAACGYAQTTKHCACAYATSGPGAVNLLSGVADAYFDSLPVVFITGQLNTYEYSGIDGLRQQGFQEIDIISMAKPITKYAVQIRNPEDILIELEKAYRIANSNRCGPVLLDLPMNIQRAEIEVTDASKTTIEDWSGQVFDYSGYIREIKALLNVSRRPLIMIGNGLTDAAAQDRILDFAHRVGIPVVTSILRRDILTPDDIINMGCIGGVYGHRYANMIASAKADCILCLGISLCTKQIGVKVSQFAKNAKLIRVDIDAPNLQRNIHENGIMEYKIHADANILVQQLLDAEIDMNQLEDNWLKICSEVKLSLQQIDDATPERYTNKIIEKISPYTKDAEVIAVDVGQHMIWCYQSFRYHKNQKMLFSGGHGAMGYALPAAIGAYYATGKPVVCICGDGAMQMNIQELQWVVREKLPILIIVMNNNSLGMIRHLQRDYFENFYAGSSGGDQFTSCNFAKVAMAYGISAVRVDGIQFDASVLESIDYSQPNLVEIMLSEDTLAFPKTCLGESIYKQQPYAPEEIYEYLLKL